MIKEVDKQNFKKIIKEKECVVVDFYANWCGPCKMLRPILEEIASQYPEISFVSIDVDKEDELSREYGIYSIPCLILFKNGLEEKRVVGLKSKDELKELLGDK